MISVTAAKATISNTIHTLAAVTVPLDKAAGCLLAEDVFTKTAIPGFNQSSMDGYAIRWQDRLLPLLICGESPAGSENPGTVLPGKAIRIFTGAPVPAGADTVVMQEKTSINNDLLRITDDGLLTGDNIRKAGADITMGGLALNAGSYLSPAALGFLAAAGIAEVAITPFPAVSVIITGSELTRIGRELKPGQVYESNSYALRAALQQAGITEIRVSQTEDNLQHLISCLKTSLEESDMVLLTGGISAGDYDFVLKATQLCGIKQIFHQVKQRPGKPLFFGMSGSIPVFGLPGNPSSVLTCFYEYVLDSIKILTGKKMVTQQEKRLLATPWKKRAGLTHFLKGSCREDGVHILDAQESYRMSSFARANCLVILPEEATVFEKGEMIDIHSI